MSNDFVLLKQNHDLDPNIYTDHKVVKAKFIMPAKVKRGPGYWKLNTSCLENPAYDELITVALQADKDKSDIGQWWERQKIRVKITSIEYARRKSIRISNALTTLKNKLKQEQDPLRIQEISDQIHDIDMMSKDGVKVRSREKDIVNEDRPTKYFYIQENHRQNQGTVTEVRAPDKRGRTRQYTTREDILEQIHKYYSDLYQSKATDPTLRDQYARKITNVLTARQRAWMDSPITIKELEAAIKDLAVNRAPGPDGIPIEFYKSFLHLLGEDLLQLFNEIFREGRPETPSQKMGYVKLAHKKDERYLLDNWRGITLLNVDHKILTKIMATRLQTLFPHIIHEDQVCTVPGRTIFDKVYLARDIIAHAEHRNCPLYLVSWDMKQAFDSVEYDYAFQLLRNYNFGDKFVGLMENLYTTRNLQIMNNGYFTRTIIRTRGWDQGDPLSLPVFCLIEEPLANTIRDHPYIEGYHLQGTGRIAKLMLYADDNNTATTKPQSIAILCEVYAEFKKASGVGLNFKKLKGLMLNTEHVPDIPNIHIHWEVRLKIVGISFCDSPYLSQNWNWITVMGKLEDKLNLLKYRSLSYKGKVQMLNSKLLSKIWYVSTVYECPKWAFKRLERILFRYLYGGMGPDLIKREIIYLPKHKGGLGLLNLISQGKALRLKYIHHIVNFEYQAKWLYFARYWIGFALSRMYVDWDHLYMRNRPQWLLDRRAIPHHYKLLLIDLVPHLEDIIRDKYKSCRSIRDIIRKPIDDRVVIGSEVEWQSFFTRLNGREVRWKSVWRHPFRSYNVGTCTDTLYKFLHNRTQTRVKLRNRNARYDTSCPICKKTDETTIHLFVQCKKFSNIIWQKYQPVFAKLLPNSRYIYEEVALTITVQRRHVKDTKAKLFRTIVEIILHEIWSARCKCLHENIKPDVGRSLCSIRSKIRYILMAHLKTYIFEDSLQNFENLFCINNAVCSLDYMHRLILHLPPWE